MDVRVIFEILELVTVYGVPAMKSIIETLGKDTVTLEDIEALKAKVKEPGEYFQGT